MDILNNWTIVIGIISIISLIFYWSKSTYLDSIYTRETEIITKVKEDISKKLIKSDLLIKKHGEEKFVDQIYDIIEFKKILRDLKKSFGNKMIPKGIFISILGVFLVSNPYNQYQPYIFLIIIIISLSLSEDFININKYHNLLSRYLEGENPSEILS